MSPIMPVQCDLPQSWDWIDRDNRRREIEERCEKSSTGCWLYPRVHPQTGYTYVSVAGDGKTVQWTGHRLMWVLTNGPIPPALYVCHACDVRACVNPSHLWLGSCDANQKDRVRKGRHLGNRRISP